MKRFFGVEAGDAQFDGGARGQFDGEAGGADGEGQAGEADEVVFEDGGFGFGGVVLLQPDEAP